MQFSFQTIAFALFAASNVLAVEPVQIEVTQAVECTRKTQSGDKLKMHYRGTLAESGKQFDASYDRGTPFSFKLGAGQVIKGWDNGLLDMCVGEKRKLTIQPEYGYGARGAGGVIGPNAVLVFETELLEIEGVKSEKQEL